MALLRAAARRIAILFLGAVWRLLLPEAKKLDMVKFGPAADEQTHGGVTESLDWHRSADDDESTNASITDPGTADWLASVPAFGYGVIWGYSRMMQQYGKRILSFKTASDQQYGDGHLLIRPLGYRAKRANAKHDEIPDRAAVANAVNDKEFRKKVFLRLVLE
ncbi:hypothetical protein BJ170DRAFT_723949 [Xylariales sp. AK1849]|nr:hypothetical protein BJ170DRAFT_723949 [Xylariales sp. AK1849]